MRAIDTENIKKIRMEVLQEVSSRFQGYTKSQILSTIFNKRKQLRFYVTSFPILQLYICWLFVLL